MTRQAFAVCLLLALVAAACSGNDQQNNDVPEDAGDVVEDTREEDDATDDDGEDTDAPDTNDSGDTGDDADAQCTPRTECDADECGTVDDGCGGTLDCDTQCNCVNGQPQGVACGECGLGQYQCDSGETGEGTCVSPDLPGLDADSTDAECSSALVYVDPLSAIAGEGTRERPYTTYREGWENATAGQTILLVSEATFSRRITVKDGVSVFGGFSHETWLFDPEMKAEFDVPVNNSDDTVGITAEGLTQNTVIGYLSVTTEDETRGGSTYGLVAVDSDTLELRGVTLEPGNGAPGVAGRSGDDGNQGTTGVPGSNSLLSAVPSGGTNSECPSAAGGAGGNGAKNPDGVTGTATPGQPAASGAIGGTAGTATDKPGKDGQDGAPVATTANDGQGGTFGGAVATNRWSPSGIGEAGEDGPHGNGGGGGGGSWHGPQYCTEADGDTKYYAGVKGAGGAAGGCGGAGGEGGQPGGGSIAVLLIRSDIVVSRSSFAARNAGDGGRGGNGGDGGAGQTAGDGGPTFGRVDGSTCDPSEPNDGFDLGFNAGAGGDGSAGGPGGAGGGGAGGPSWGVYCVDSTPSIDDATTINAGAAGTGGPSNGNAGEDGVAAPLKDCP